MTERIMADEIFTGWHDRPYGPAPGIWVTCALPSVTNYEWRCEDEGLVLMLWFSFEPRRWPTPPDLEVVLTPTQKAELKERAHLPAEVHVKGRGDRGSWGVGKPNV